MNYVQNWTVERNSWKIPVTELHYYGSYRFLVCIFGRSHLDHVTAVA